MSARWAFTSNGHVVATAQRRRRHPSMITVGDARWSISHDGWEGIRILDETGDEVARATRLDTLGRTWQLDCGRSSYQLACESMLRRRWSLGPPGAPFASVRGGVVSFNSMRIDTGLQIPISAVLLAWQIIVRSWEAAAASKAD